MVHHLYIPLRCLWLYVLFVACAQADEMTPKIVVSIKPVYALVSGVMQGVGRPTLLLDNGQSPHHASLRPSQMRALSQADLIFWVGPQLEAFLPRVFRSLTDKTTLVTLIANPDLHLLAQRSAHNHDEHSTSAAMDPHIWLSTDNVKVMITQIAQQLSRQDPAHAATYLRNSQKMHHDIDDLRQELVNKFKSDTSYISYHDAYQYFEFEFGLHYAGSVSQNEELQPGAHRIRELRQTIVQQPIRCLVYEAPQRPAVINTLLQDTSARAVELDSLGLRQPVGDEDWFKLMYQLANSFNTCLNTQNPSN